MSTLKAAAHAMWLPVLLVALWQIASHQRWVNPFFFPPPSEVLAAGWGMAASGEVFREFSATLGRYLWGSAFGILTGILTGILMGSADWARRAGEPLLAALYSTPKITLLPLLMLVFGLGDLSKIILIAAVSMIYLSRQTLDAIRSIDRHYVDIARNYRASRLAVILRVYFPAALPQIFTGLRIALTRSMVTAITLEMVSGQDGVGAVIWMAWQTMATDRLYVGILLAATFGISITWILDSVEKSVIPWRRGNNT